MNTNLFEAALERTKGTWSTYIAAICALHLTLTINLMSGTSFFRGESAIEIFGFKVYREALSFTYGILFLLFVTTVFLESRLIERCAADANLSTRDDLPELDLWFLSPFSRLWQLRLFFWCLFVDGFAFLALFVGCHLTLKWPPDPTRMTRIVYVGIGAVDLVVFVVCAFLGYKTYHNIQSVRHLMSRKG